MSVEIQYFFNYPKELEDLASDINVWIGCNLSPQEDNDSNFYSRFLSMEFSLFTAAHLESDGELDFESFKYQLRFRTPLGDADARPIQLPAILVVVYALHRSLCITGMLVYEVEMLLARYVERDVDGYGRRLFDVLSNSAFISFPAHLDIVKKRLPQSWQDFYGDNPAGQENSD